MDSEHGDAVSVEGESLFAKRLMIEIEAFRAAGLALQVSKHLIAVGYADRSRRILALTADKPALKPFAAPRQDPRDDDDSSDQNHEHAHHGSARCAANGIR